MNISDRSLAIVDAFLAGLADLLDRIRGSAQPQPVPVPVPVPAGRRQALPRR